jgi:thiol-disulfide isomerase/thioredoxin
VTRIAAVIALLVACRGSEREAPDPDEAQAAPAREAPDPGKAQAAPAREAPDPGEAQAARAREALVGTLAPVAAVDLLGGGRIQLQELIGRKPVYLKFWATWCVPCREQMPHLEAAHRKYGDRIAIVAVNLGLNDSVALVREFQAAHQLTVPIAIDDGSLAELFHVAVTPQHILVDRAGVVRHVGHGATAELDRALESLLDDDAGASAPARRPEPPADAPLSLTLLDGSTFTLAAHRGRPVVLSFVKASCDTYLAESRPAMARDCAAHARKIEAVSRNAPDVVWISIAYPVWATNKTLVRYRERLGVSSPIGLDEAGAWFHRFGVRHVPTTVFLDARGAEVARVGGAGDDLPRALARLR